MKVKRLGKLFLCLLVVCVVAATPVFAVGNGIGPDAGRYYYDMSYECLYIVNADRANAGLAPMEMEQSLFDYAMVRAKELATTFSHTRPDGSSFSSGVVLPGECGEMIFRTDNFAPAFTLYNWMNSAKFAAEILSNKNASIGFGMYQQNGISYVACLMSVTPGTPTAWEDVKNGWVTNANGTFSYYEIGNLIRDAWLPGVDEQLRYVDANGIMVVNEFKTDGQYTYFLQANGSPMKNRLTYHPNGVDLIYFDKDGHELFDTFQYCEDVGYTCYFNTFGYLYKDEITFSGGKTYYLDGNGRLKQNEYFRFENGVDLGYAEADGSLRNNGFSNDPYGQTVFYHWNGMIARGLITDGLWFYNMDLTDGHLLGKFAVY